MCSGEFNNKASIDKGLRLIWCGGIERIIDQVMSVIVGSVDIIKFTSSLKVKLGRIRVNLREI